MTKENSSVKTT